MPAWATVAITVGASLIAVAGTLLAGVLQERRGDARAERQARRQRVAEGMNCLARIQILLSNGDPDRLGINLNRDDPYGALRPLSNEWHESLWPALATFALADDSAEVRELGQQLGVAVANSLTSSGWMLGDMMRNRADLDPQQERARADHAKARELAAQLETAIRGN